MLRRLFERWGNTNLQDECERLRRINADLREDVASLESKNRIAQIEIDELAAVVARNIKRVESETSAAVAAIAKNERA